MKQTWFEALKDRLRSAWDVLLGRAYAGYSLPNDTEELRLRIALCEIDDLADDEVDITNNGGPNLAMRVQGIVRAALSSPMQTK